MIIKSLFVSNFRNLQKQKVKLSPSLNLFIGNNGQGKTNLLETIYLLSRGQSFRPTSPDSFVLNSSSINKANIELDFILQENDYKAQLLFNGGRKYHNLNGKKVTAQNMSSYLPCILFSPESLSAIKQGPDMKRALIDDAILIQSFENSKLYSDYKKALKTRNRILKDYKTEVRNLQSTQDLLESLNPKYLELCTHWTFLRLQFVNAITEKLKIAYEWISNQKNNDISLNYVISSQKAFDWDINQVYDLMLLRMKELATSELQAGVSLIGPHKHDIQFLVDGQDARYFCSQGQQRALILSFKMAQISSYKNVKGVSPLLLLDDVLSELDKEKRTRLLEFLTQSSGQIFVTSTDLDLTRQLNSETYKVFDVRNGLIECQ